MAAVTPVPNPRRAGTLHAHLIAAPRGATGSDAIVQAVVTLAFVAGLHTLRTQIDVLEYSIAEQLAAHPDATIFTSLPKAGRVRAARLIAEIGDCRSRYPTPQALISLAGAAPSTRQSGKVTAVSFRYAVDKQLRGAVMDFAGDSHHANHWAATFTGEPVTAARLTPTPPASWPEPGFTSFGDAGKIASPTTPPDTAPTKP